MCVSVYEEGDKKGDRGSGGGGGGKGSGIIVTHTVHIQCVKTAANILRQASKLHKLQDERWGHKLKTRSIQNANWAPMKQFSAPWKTETNSDNRKRRTQSIMNDVKEIGSGLSITLLLTMWDKNTSGDLIAQ